MSEEFIVQVISNYLTRKGYFVANEISNLYRSADIVAVNEGNEVIVVECKVSAINKAIRQLKTHKLAADKIYIGTFCRNTRKDTLNKIADAGIGLIYVDLEGEVSLKLESSQIKNNSTIAKDKLISRIIET